MSNRITGQLTYEYKNAPIPGGGYVTGFVYHKTRPGILYARTDIGGTYRFNYKTMQWESLINHVTALDLEETYPIALALDPENGERLYIACGIYQKPEGKLCISEDRGQTFTYKRIPTPVHGNLSGRGTGYRLVVDKTDSNVLYFASQQGGLWRTKDKGDSWEKLPVPEDYTTFVWVSDDSRILVVGTAGYTTRYDETLRGHSLYVSYDGGETFDHLKMPDNVIVTDSKMNGLVASRYDYDGTYLYITCNSTGRWNYIVDLGYSCDTGDVIGGKVLRYYFENGRIAGYDDITPGGDGKRTDGYLNYGFGGISSCAAKPGLLACSTLCREKEEPEAIYVSEDYGNTWRISLCGLEIGGMEFHTSYMKPKYNSNVSLLHWQSDVKIDPFDPDRLWLNSGTGVFTTEHLLEEGKEAYHDHCHGIEETVHLNVYAPLNGQVQVVDIVGDLGGFAFRDLTMPCENSFDDAEGNRYITCINADISDMDSSKALITARGNWKGKTKGGLIRTGDGFTTFSRIAMPFYLGGKVAKQMEQIEHPNTNPGWVAMSPDGQNLVWSVADGIILPMDMVVYSNDGGETFGQSVICDSDGTPLTEGCLKVYSDRMANQRFYGFGEMGRLYISLDGGASFTEKKPVVTGAMSWPKVDFGMIDTANKTEIRGVAGEEGVFFMALGEHGLWKYVYDCSKEEIFLSRLSMEGDSIFRMGLGLGKENGNYVEDPKAIYLSGIIDGCYGFYRTLDEGRTYDRLNTKEQMFGEINSIDGDKRTYGRFYLATGSRGLLYGDITE